MRLGALWGAAALALLAVAAGARITQVDGATRGRRLQTPSSVESSDLANSTKDAEPTYRIRGSRRKEETSAPNRDIPRSRGRPAPTPTTDVADADRTQTKDGRNERFDSRRTRTRNGSVENETTVSSSTAKTYVVRSRSRFSSQRQSPSPKSSTETSSERNDLTDIEKTPSDEKEDIPITNQFRRRSFVSQTTEKITPTQFRGRYLRKNNGRSLELSDIGNTNPVTVLGREPTTARSTEDVKVPRKLRYKTRLSEVDTNLTGEGLVTSNDKVKKVTEQTEINTIQIDQSTESLNTLSTEKTSEHISLKPETKSTSTKITRRVPVRGKGGYKPSFSTSAPKISDEVSEDDNYPESFKALLQAKSASTQANSPDSESLSVKASQTVYKTYIAPSQSTDTDITSSNDLGFKNKLKIKEQEESISNDVASNKTKIVESKSRTLFKPRTRKYSSFSTTPKALSTLESVSSTEKPAPKYNRKLKFTTTQSPNLDKSKDKEELRSKWKKPLIRQSYISRRKPEGNESVEIVEAVTSSPLSRKVKPTRNELLSKYSRSNRFKSTSTTEASEISPMVDQSSTEKVADNTANMPFVITLLSSTENNEQDPVTDKTSESSISNGENNIFIIAVSSTESVENKVNYQNSAEEQTGNRPYPDVYQTTSKYHPNFNTPQTESSEVPIVSTSPRIKNIRLRNQDHNNAVTQSPEHETPQKYRGRYNRKYESENKHKTTDGASNVITPQPDRVKSRFSSKYRASHGEKPIYKATVPTVTPSTAWLKFFVTDHLLTKTAEEPIWFDEADFYTTESMPRQFITSSPYIHEPPLQLVEGEEIQLGPNMNAFSIMQTQRPLSSADLRLAESLEKPLHIMNVEASQHSPSVTVSIFGALADILTSTPRTPRLSSTTDISQNNIVDVKESLVDVSNITNVNNTEGLTSQNVNINKEVNTVQTTANVINNLSDGDLVTMSISTNDEVIPTFFQSTTPNPTSTTPISARRPFGFKILYSNTETPTNNIKTASTIYQVSTDSPSNTVSDILIPSNNLVSSELTSMLTNNIRDILQNLDTSNKDKLSVDMAQLLKSLIPKALDRRTTALDDVETIINTTPFSLEEIRDTQNVDTGIVDLQDTNNLQSELSESLVNSTLVKDDGFVSNYTDKVLVNNIPDYYAVQANSQVTSTENTKNDLIEESDAITTISSLSSDFVDKEESGLLGKIIIDSVTEKSTISDTVNVKNLLDEQLPVPFFTNSQVQENDDTDASLDNQDKPLVKSLVVSVHDTKVVDSIDTNSSPMKTKILPTQQVLSPDGQSSVQISPIQLWILSRKAKVLQMIEELLRQHNDELAKVPLEGLVSSTNDILLSNRLTKILDVMNGTADPTDSSRLDDSRPDTVSPSTIPSFDSYSVTPLMSTTEVLNFGDKDSSNPTKEMNIDETRIQVTTPTTVNEKSTTITTGATNTFTTTQKPENIQEYVQTTSTAPLLTTNFAVVESDDSSINDKTVTENSNDFIEQTFKTEGVTLFTSSTGSETTTTAVLSTENTTTEKNVNAVITENSTPIEIITTQEPTNSINDIVTTTNSNIDFSLSTGNSISSDTSNQAAISSETSIPKKDYVIFGILPNNTVVRKDPNDDILETLTEASPYIIYGVLPNNTIIRRFPNGTRVPRVMQKIDVLSISPWSLKNPYSPIHNNPAIVRPKSNPIQINAISETSTNAFSNGNEIKLTNDTVNNLQNMIPPSTIYVNGSSSFDITMITNKPPAEKSTASHVLSLRTSTTLPSVDEILLNSISSAIKEDMVLSEQKMSTDETRILTLDIDPETKQIRTEKPGDGSEGAIFKFIPVDEVTVASADTNVLKITSTKATTSTAETTTTTSTTVTELQEQEIIESSTTVTPSTITTTEEQKNIYSNPSTTEVAVEINETKPDLEVTFVASTTSQSTTSTEVVKTNPPTTSTYTATTTQAPIFTTPTVTTTTEEFTTPSNILASTLPTTSTLSNYVSTTNVPPTESTSFSIQTTSEVNNYEEEATLLSSLLKNTERNPKNLNGFPMQFPRSGTNQQEILLNALLQANSNTNKVKVAPTTPRSLEEDIRQLEEDTKLLKALLAATGQDPSKLNLPNLENFNIPSTAATKSSKVPTTTSPTTLKSITTTLTASTQSVDQVIFENEKLLAKLLQGTQLNTDQLNAPIISGETSHVRVASNLQTTPRNSNPTTPYNIRPIYTTTTTVAPTAQTTPPIVSFNQLQQEIVTEEIGGISTTYTPKFTTSRSVPTRRSQSRRLTTTTEVPSTSTFSVQEDLMFLQNLKTVLKTNSNNEDPEAALANRIIALAVERSLNEIQTGNQTVRTENSIAETTAAPTTTTTLRTTTTPPTTTTQTQQTPSLEEDIKQFEEDTKLLKALIQATGQDPSAFNIPTLPSIISTTTVSSTTNKIVTNSLPSRTLKPSKPFTQQAIITTAKDQTTVSTAVRPFGARIAVKDNLKTLQDDEKLLKTLVKLQGGQEITTQRPKLAVTGQTRDEALNTLIKQKKPAVMVSEATKSPMSLSTEYGKSKDALLAALLKEQGFGPTTASSMDEQQRLTALLNQVVVTPKARRTTTLPPPPPPPAPRRPILDGLAWLWQQWQETGPGPGGSRPKQPASTPPAGSAGGGGQRVNWFGSGPFIGNADDGSSSNRIPLEPPHTVTSQQAPGRGQLVSAAINVTRAFSQFLGAAIQGAAQTVQSVFRAGQRVAADAYTNGSGGSG